MANSFVSLAAELLLPNGIGRTAGRSVHGTRPVVRIGRLSFPASEGMQVAPDGWKKQR